jgi:hypothetical protein
MSAVLIVVADPARATKTALATAKSGWDEFERFLRSQGIESPVRLSQETHYVPNPDRQILAVEVRADKSCSSGHEVISSGA